MNPLRMVEETIIEGMKGSWLELAVRGNGYLEGGM
nr:hypothetical protein Q903MT_gene309 [Picea sitchensis]